MDYDQFINSLKMEHPPEVSAYLKALWFEKNNGWDKAHSIVQEIHDRNGAWIHAYLHRVEGDQWNAGYWYGRADRKMPGTSTEDEWETLVRTFLTGPPDG